MQHEEHPTALRLSNLVEAELHLTDLPTDMSVIHRQQDASHVSGRTCQRQSSPGAPAASRW